MLNLDNLIIEFDKGLRTLFAKAPTARPYPDADIADAELSEAEKKHAAALIASTTPANSGTGLVSGASADGARSCGAGEAETGSVGRNRTSGLDLASRTNWAAG